MKNHFRATSLSLVIGITLAAMAFAHEPEQSQAVPAAKITTSATVMPVFVHNIDPSAEAAVKVVDAFSAAIKAAKLDAAEKLLDPDVLILESGSSERSRDEYMQHHAGADAAFLQHAQQQLRYRKAKSEGNFAWVATESSLEAVEGGKKILLLSTETMLLRKTGTDWRIVHIHWSSRPAPTKTVPVRPGA